MNKTVVPTLELRKVVKTFKQGSQKLDVLKGVDLEIMPGEIVALLGPSGSGKSTMLQIAGLLDRPSKGEIYLDGQKCSKLGDGLRTALRRDYLGFVYQYHNLLADFDATENVMLPQLIAGVKFKAAREKAQWLLSRLKLEKRFKHRPAELSGGEQQRVAIARALANTPKLLLADEPTGNLDPRTADIVFAELLAIVKETGLSALIATHNFELAYRMDRRKTASWWIIGRRHLFRRREKIFTDWANGGEMMKRLSGLSVLILLGMAGVAEAKYVFPPDHQVKSRSEEIAEYQMKEYDKDGDGALSLEEFEKRFEKLTREDRRNIRRNKKNGTYQTPEEQFKAMDKNNDGLVSEKERADYIREQRDNGNFLY